MKKNKEILDEFGKIFTNEVFDDNLKYSKQILNGTTKWGQGSEYIKAFQSLDKENKEVVEKFFIEYLKTNLFSFLSIFESHEEFKLYYEKGTQKVNLVEISEMLKAEPIIENGWIERFSKELKK
ncbi:hypothetical protein ACQY1Q_10775 [Tenacibaculum sp. TC6]|uniref:hypothetical protein n=1 Tax=Tenacibaculum sp. TC6 TaxID=3423223 RepID=UPI003D359B29